MSARNAKIGSRPQLLLPHEVAHLSAVDVADVGGAVVDLGYTLGVDIEAGNLVARLGELHGLREADVAEADDADLGSAGANLVFELHRNGARRGADRGDLIGRCHSLEPTLLDFVE
jgi:hypothetical protein